MSIRRSSRRILTAPKKQFEDYSDSDNEIENISMNSPHAWRNCKVNMKKILVPLEQKTPTSSKKRQAKRRQQKALESDEDSTDETSADDIKSVEVSPPKQQKFQQSRQAENLFSPSRLIDRLSIEDHDSDSDSGKETTKVKFNKYQNASKVLNSCETNSLPGREKELQDLEEFFESHIAEQKSGSLYVSGQPGTGKTACLSKLLKSEKFAGKIIKVYVNCTSISTVGAIYKKICSELKIKVNGKTEKDNLIAIEKYLGGKHKMILLVLDEIDQLCGQKQAVLYTIFEWPSKQQSKLLLVGIANSLDLTDRMLVRLNAKCNLKPKLLHFSPYTKQQIFDIFKSRLEEAGVMDIFPAVTIQLLAGKVAAVSGDVRRALDIGRRVIEIAERDGKSTLNINELVLEKPENYIESESITKPVQLKQVATVLNDVYGQSQMLGNDIETGFPLQQKILVCTLLLMLKKGKNKDITIGRLHDVYKRVCFKRNILAVDQSEFVGLCALVDTRGIVRIIRKKEPRLSKVTLQWDQTEVHDALKDKQLIATILEDDSCLLGR